MFIMEMFFRFATPIIITKVTRIGTTISFAFTTPFTFVFKIIYTIIASI